jgi:hypothetical protein
LIFDFRFLILDWHLEAVPAASNAMDVQSKIKNLKSKITSADR